MCGVIGLVHDRHRSDLGLVAGELLRALEYRGYDSTGAAIQGDTPGVDLRKDVGAPSKLVAQLGIDRLGGRVLCAQVRWATFGAVNAVNAQPHVVRCHTYLYGAHNGNVTNCDDLKAWLTSEGHRVVSDNDGEMVVHTVEHFFAKQLARAGGNPNDALTRQLAMRAALAEAHGKLRGSYAAVIVDPLTYTLWGVKKGSSFYFGYGEAEGSRFAIASSDLSAVLKLTRALIPLTDGEVVEFEATRHTVLRMSDGTELPRKPVRSRLRVQDTALQPPFTTFMEQEIQAQVEATRQVVQGFNASGEQDAWLEQVMSEIPANDRAQLLASFEQVREQVTDPALAASMQGLLALPAVRLLVERHPELGEVSTLADLRSSERGLFLDLGAMVKTREGRGALRLLDAFLAENERMDLQRATAEFVRLVEASRAKNGRIFLLSCGSSFHAAKTAALFFNDLAGVSTLPLLPGELRGQHSGSMRDGDLVIAISQSGETKDLVDVINDVITSGLDIKKVALVNNVNSTLAQEKSDLTIPLRSGPETAVAATKSFMNQLAVLYGLALAVAEKTCPGEALVRRRRAFAGLPELIDKTLRETAPSVEKAASMLFLRPSIHLLATRLLGVAKEGALKIREVVLNHTEGFEGSEFKHGPNTILGLNTVFGLDQVERLLAQWGGPKPTVAEVMRDTYVDYPLVYITGPQARDVDLTVSQINTHKIRGASTIVIAQDDPALRGAAEKAPADSAGYEWGYIALPRAEDPLLTAFSATVVLQRMALLMSLKKKEHLDRLGVPNHGVHPDVPKNVSKSITVD